VTPIKTALLAISKIPQPDRLVMFEELAAAGDDPNAMLLIVGRFAIARLELPGDPPDYTDAQAVETTIATLTGELAPYLP
jgi:hypothetical protein